jgi:hypothetical protein
VTWVNRQCKEFCTRLFLGLGLLLVAPFLLVLMLFDHKHLRKVAEEIEPPEPVPTPRSIIDWMLLRLLRPVIIIVALPLIVLVGLFQMVFGFGKTEDDDVIW